MKERVPMKHATLIIALLTIFTATHADHLAEINDCEIDFGILSDKDDGIYNKPSYEEYFNRGTIALRKGDIDKAIINFEKSLKENATPPQTHFNLAIAYETQGRIDDAIEAYKDALIQKLNYPKAHHQLAKLLQQRGLIDQAIIHYEQALKFDSDLVEPALTVARLYCGQTQWAESLPYFERFLSKHPNDITAKFEYANSLNTANQTEEALEVYYELLRDRPNEGGILYNTAYTLKKLGRVADAMPYYEAALKRNPNHSEAHFSLGLAYLITGDFKKGWPEYEWRWQRNTQLTPREFAQPQWKGEQLDGKIILLHAEQGLGDTFQFIRYAKLIKEEYGGIVYFASQRPLQNFISRCCPYIDKVVTLDTIPSSFAVHAPLLSLPYILESEENTIPKEIPYIFPDSTLIEFWRKKLTPDKQFKVGICWQGNNKYSTPFLRSVVAAKSIPINNFFKLAHVPGVTFYSLQRETGTDQLTALPNDFKLVTFEQDFDQSHGRFMDTAAVIKNLDLVITVDTSIAHLSAAIGTPVWTFIPEPPDWRWMLKRPDTPWYPNMKLFRQSEPGDWDSVMNTVTSELTKLVKKRTPQTYSPEEFGTTIAQGTRTSKSSAPRTNNLLHQHVFSTIEQLHKELVHVKTQFKIASQKLTATRFSSDDQECIEIIRTLYHLGEMHATIKQKILALEGVG